MKIQELYSKQLLLLLFAHLGLKVSAGSAETTDFLRRYLRNKKQLSH